MLPGNARTVLKSGVMTMLAGLSCLFAASADATLQNEESLEKLRSGEILFETLAHDEAGGSARVSGYFLADKESIWNIIGYCRYAYIYIQGLNYCEMLQGDGRYMIQQQQVRHSWYTPTLDFTFEAKREVNEYGEARLLSGNLRGLEANWQLVTPADGVGVVVTHELRIQLKLPVPRWLIRRGLRNDLPDMLACIRGLAEGSLSPAGAEADMERCPGEIPAEEEPVKE
jgi:hypothetical protein